MPCEKGPAVTELWSVLPGGNVGSVLLALLPPSTRKSRNLNSVGHVSRFKNTDNIKTWKRSGDVPRKLVCRPNVACRWWRLFP